MMPQLCNILAMLIFGTIALFVKEIPFLSGTIAFLRTSIGAVTLLLVIWIRKEPLQAERREWTYILLSACFLVGNWVFLFQGFRYTSVSNATILYYLAPILIVVYAALRYHQHIAGRTWIALFGAMLGLIFISYDAFQMEWKGILYALLAACCYAALVLVQRHIHMASLPFTFLQLTLAAILLFPYVLLTQEPTALMAHFQTALPWVIGLGVIHTGLAYTLYFTSLPKLRVEQVALYSYLDPCMAMMMSLCVLKEQIHFLQGIGIFCIVFAIIYSRKRGDEHVL